MLGSVLMLHHSISAASFTADQRSRIMREVLEDHISPADLAKKYNISAHAIRDWVKKAGHALPKSYKRFIFHVFDVLRNVPGKNSR